jgi:hypothetical protein
MKKKMDLCWNSYLDGSGEEPFYDEEKVIKLDYSKKRIGVRRSYVHGRWRCRDGENHKVKGVSPWSRSERILKAYLGKPFDEAFSFYCSISPKYQQHIFLGYFNKDSYYSERYSVDDKGILILHPDRYIRRKEPCVFYSIDYEVDYKDKKTGKIMGKSYFNYHWSNRNDYESIVIRGFSRTFSSSKDHVFQRLQQEKLRKQRLIRKKEWKEKLQKVYCFKTQEELLRRQTAEDLRKRDSHGFDKHSFMGNPYHGQQRKKK